jgi:scyllo-inositol 2-dehydrogenase (NADP+)
VSARVGCAILGYGPVFDFGRAHAQWISGVPDLQLLAICDRDSACAAKAATEFPVADVYGGLDEMLARDDVDLVTVVTPHNTHADLAVRCLRAGKHVIVDKPMCITVAEADAMMGQAERAGRTLAVFHNRRRDGNYRLVHKLVREGAIGRVFHVELKTGYFGPAGAGWRADKAVCGGVLYDWGAHAADWLLTLVPSRVVAVSGYFHKLRWDKMTIADQGRAVVRFEDGTVGDLSFSYLDAAPGPLWRILGTEGAIVDSGQDSWVGYHPEYRFTCQSPGKLRLIRCPDGEGTEEEIQYLPSTWGEYYIEMAHHLLAGGPVPVPASDGRRAIGLLEAAERSARSNREVAVTI